MTVAERFSLHIQEKDEMDLRPVFTDEGVTYVYIKCNNLLLMAVTKRNSNIALVLFFLSKLTGVFKDYFGELEEESIRDNFVVVYELLDETMDFGERTRLDRRIAVFSNLLTHPPIYRLPPDVREPYSKGSRDARVEPPGGRPPATHRPHKRRVVARRGHQTPQKRNLPRCGGKGEYKKDKRGGRAGLCNRIHSMSHTTQAHPCIC